MTAQDTAQKSRKPHDYTAPYRCPFGHQSDLYLIMRQDGNNEIRIFRGSAWDFCNNCNAGPNPVQRMQADLNIYRQWRAAGVIDQDQYHKLANSAVTRETRRPGGPVGEILDKFNELTFAIETRAGYDHKMKEPEPSKHLLGLRRDLIHMKTNFQNWAVREGFMIEPKPKIMDVELPKTDQPDG